MVRPPGFYLILLFTFSVTVSCHVMGMTASEFEKANTCHYDETLVMDVWTSYSPSFAISDFKRLIREKYKKNIDIHTRLVLTPDEFFDRVRAGITDIISPSHNFLKDERTQFIRNHMVIPLNEHLIPNLKRVAPRYISNNFVTDKGKLYAVPIAAGGYNLLYHRDHFKKAPDSWSILWEDKYKGKYSLSRDFYEANIYITALALGIQPDKMDNIELVNTPVFRAKLKQLLENANYWSGAPKESDLRNSILTTGWGLSYSVSQDIGHKWQLAFPKEGVSFWTDYLAVTRNVERSPLAKIVAMEWLNYVIDRYFQEQWIIKQRRYISPLSPEHLRPSFVTNKDRKEIQYLYHNSTYWPILTVRNRNGLKLIYDEVLGEIERSRGQSLLKNAQEKKHLVRQFPQQ